MQLIDHGRFHDLCAGIDDPENVKVVAFISLMEDK